MFRLNPKLNRELDCGCSNLNLAVIIIDIDTYPNTLSAGKEVTALFWYNIKSKQYETSAREVLATTREFCAGRDEGEPYKSLEIASQPARRAEVKPPWLFILTFVICTHTDKVCPMNVQPFYGTALKVSHKCQGEANWLEDYNIMISYDLATEFHYLSSSGDCERNVCRMHSKITVTTIGIGVIVGRYDLNRRNNWPHKAKVCLSLMVRAAYGSVQSYETTGI
ncbi:hypothetical protein EVAR_33372_1 [Eumeta japonica]|uniref:Uncharacterized protein n=1 Tax=Eumeta variegata TaxID=151549 RepID=A0A4C1X430_EUMVA|nr:hypothetical protein EVAR_33372_1 [Eumeta japonica]